MTSSKKILLYATIGVVFVFFTAMLLVKAQGFLIPLITAIILALVVLPISRKLESVSLGRATAALVNTFLLLLISTGFMFLISLQIKNVMDDWEKIKTTMEPKLEKLKSAILEHSPMNEENVNLDQQNIPFVGESSGSSEKGKASDFFGGVMSFLGDFLLTFIYVFFILTYRKRFKDFLLKLFPKEKSREVKKVIDEIAKVTQQYLVGKLLLIGILALLYSIGLGFSGVDNFIVISLLAAALSIIPYIGNIIGFGIALTFGYLTSGETGILIGIIITFSVAQFVESYILEPYIVGDRVDLHPFFVILAVVVGNIMWGVMGMILSIPILAILNVILLHIPSLQALGFLLSNKSSSEKN